MITRRKWLAHALPKLPSVRNISSIKSLTSDGTVMASVGLSFAYATFHRISQRHSKHIRFENINFKNLI